MHWDRPARVLPPSLYLTEKPAFFGTNPWPWVDPTGERRLGVLPARARYEEIVKTYAPPTLRGAVR